MALLDIVSTCRAGHGLEDRDPVDLSFEPLVVSGPPGTIEFMLNGVMAAPAATNSLDLPSDGAKEHLPEIQIVEWSLGQKGGSKEVVRNGIRFTLTKLPADQAKAAAEGPPPQLAQFYQVPLPSETRVNGPRWDVKQVPLVDGLTWTVPGSLGFTVHAAQLKHRVPCFGYVFQARRRLRRACCFCFGTYQQFAAPTCSLSCTGPASAASDAASRQD